MYEFRDTIDTSDSVSLPSEALKLNGEYIENLIPGYRTLTVSGREALSPELSFFDTGIRDGSTMKGKRYPARTIRVAYQLIAQSNEDFRAAYNKLAHILDVKDAELIFNDEQDKFFTGTPAFIGEVEPGRNSVIGEFEILCLDPFKYSVMEYQAMASEGETSVLLDYNGTYKSFPTLQAEFYNESETSEDGETVTELTGAGDCGYVAFFNESEKIIQLGDPDEVDGNEGAHPYSQTLVNQKFDTKTSWGTAAKKLWAVNSGITSSSVVVQTGNVGIGVASVATETIPAKTSGTLLNDVVSTYERPYIHYTVTAQTSDRTENSVKVLVTAKARLDNSQSYFKTGYGLRGYIYIGGVWKNFDIKKTNEVWEGKSWHNGVITVTVTGLSASTAQLTGIKFKVLRTDSTGGQSGLLSETACANLKISTYTAPTPTTYYLQSTNYGTGEDWHGASITRTLPADETGEVGAKDFILSYSQKMSIGITQAGSYSATKEKGAFQVLLVSGSGTDRKIVAGVNVYKGADGKQANLRFYINGKVQETTTVDLSHDNKYFNSTKTSKITKIGTTIQFDICGIRRTYRAISAADLIVNEVTFTFTKFGTSPALTYNGLYWAKFVKNNCETYEDIPNKFSANDVVEADCKTGEILLNGVSTPALGALGNDWEEFFLTPGLNQIGFAYSDWVTSEYAPTVRVKYREVFL